MRRPTGFVILALLTGWLALAGFANAAVMMLPAAQEAGFGSPLLALGAVIYGGAAAAAAAGLWQVRPWALRAYLAWVGSVVLIELLFVFTFGRYMPPAPGGLPWVAIQVLFVLVMAAVLSLPALYIRNRLQRLPG